MGELRPNEALSGHKRFLQEKALSFSKKMGTTVQTGCFSKKLSSLFKRAP